MFDESSRRLLRSAPNLKGLDAETLDQLLTEAHVVLATVRGRIGGVDDEATLERIRRLAATFEAYVALGIRPDQRRAAAFVAASAHQIVAQAARSRREGPSLVSSDAIDSSISSILLFLLAERTADAHEAAARLRAQGEARAARRTLILSIREFARSELATVVERDLEKDRIPNDESREAAADLLYRECSYVVQMLAKEALGFSDDDAAYEKIKSRLERVMALARVVDDGPGGSFEGPVYLQFSGPYHLAALLMALIDGVRETMLVKLPVPSGGTNASSWISWLTTQAETRPFLWTNHLAAVRTGYLNRGVSMVMTSPTGSGKTTLAVLKIAAARCAGKGVVYLAPTHALVDQVEEDLSGEVGHLESNSVEDLDIEEIGERLPDIAVMTPERCLALINSEPALFANVGLLVFDEFHLISADTAGQIGPGDSRAIDAMLALLSFLECRKDADLLLLSAMVSNGNAISEWLKNVWGREVRVFDDPWKPTRQLRSCVIYDQSELQAAYAAAQALPIASDRKKVKLNPLGLFSLIAGWHPNDHEKLLIRPITSYQPPLAINQYDSLTANRNIVAAEIAAEYAALGKRVIVFCADTKACGSVRDHINELLKPANVTLNEAQEALRSAALADVGCAKAVFDPSGLRAAVHHGDLLPVERRLVESVFKSRRPKDEALLGVDVVAATSTISQGLNLPCDVVILAGTDRSAKDDPSGNPRQNLKPHEILNALGRAGRAAYAATGVAIVVPATPIFIDLAEMKFPAISPLPIVFSEKDACSPILDPIEQLLDQIESSAISDPRMQGMIRRLAAVAQDGKIGFDGIARGSFGYHQRRTLNEETAYAWLSARREAIKAAALALTDPPVLDWQQELAVRNGIPPEIIARVDTAYHLAPVHESTTAEWIDWLLDTCVLSESDLKLFVRGSSLEAVFGRAWSKPLDRNKAFADVLNALKHITRMWCGGKTIVEIEAHLLNFIRAHEGEVKIRSSQSATAHRARRFAIRILPDIGFLSSLFAQVAAHRALEIGVDEVPIASMLQRMVKAGDYDRHHTVLRIAIKNPSRIISLRACNELRTHFTAGTLDPIEAVQGDIRRALILQGFDDFGDDFDDLL
ncbi:DEAD/DEAH box helicase [Celeribacter indicus]|uniref:DEAD/DEAH box helicase n=1 Tax=Celeribacter indicus TaxID=1208324 RepID=A0A0B5DRI3_9RHOB|nr:DEAD/DEAH box helicase [Celeribacter indicus]AJE45654.1 DEAD/DEAH box helicase [Celeribacter indicus]SDX54706.1 Helicase conserved C-terminal domain-containing protein [Celeribacter indicus]